MKRVEIEDHGPKVSRPTIIVGVPEAGLVGTIATSYLVEQLKMEERGHIDSDYMPPLMVVHNSQAKYPVHIFGKGDIIVVLAEVPLAGRIALEMTKEIASWAKSQHAKLLIGMTGAPSREREESQADGKPNVVGVANDKESLDTLKQGGVMQFEEGIISGFYAGLIKFCSKNQQSGIVLLAESLSQFPDPGAAQAAIDVLNKLVPLNIDTNPLAQEAEAIRLRTRELMQQTQQTQQSPMPAGGTAYR